MPPPAAAWLLRLVHLDESDVYVFIPFLPEPLVKKVHRGIHECLANSKVLGGHEPVTLNVMLSPAGSQYTLPKSQVRLRGPTGLPRGLKPPSLLRGCSRKTWLIFQGADLESSGRSIHFNPLLPPQQACSFMYPMGIFFIIFPLNLINPHSVMNLEISLNTSLLISTELVVVGGFLPPCRMFDCARCCHPTLGLGTPSSSCRARAQDHS